MSNIFNYKEYDLGNLLTQVHNGSIALPDLQRPFVWDQIRVRDLLDSIYKGLPVGYFLLWNAFEPKKYRTIGTNGKQMDPNYLVIDGQQRLTSLYAVRYGEPVGPHYARKRIKISFKPLEEIFEVHNAAIANDPEWIQDISEVFTATNLYEYIHNSYIEKLKQKREISSEEIGRIDENIHHLVAMLKYDITTLELVRNLDAEEVAEIFVRINSKGVVLKQSDFILTLLSVYWKEGREKLEEFCGMSRKKSEDGEQSSYNNIVYPDPDQIIRTIVALAFLRGRLRYAYILLQGKDLEEKSKVISESIRKKNFSKFKEAQEQVLNLTNWHDYIDIIKTAGFVNESMIPGKINFYTTYAIYLIGKYHYKVSHRDLEKIIKKWYIFSLLTFRYSGSAESNIEKDLVLFRKNDLNFVQTLEKIIEANLTKDYWNVTLPQNLVTSSSMHFAYIAYLAAQSVTSTNVMFSETKLREVLSTFGEINYKKNLIDKHHLYPKNYLTKIGIKEVRDQNQVANFTYLKYKDNIEISDDPPRLYWQKAIKEFDEKKIKKIRTEHAIPEEFPNLNYFEFLEKRRYLMAQTIKKAFNKI